MNRGCLGTPVEDPGLILLIPFSFFIIMVRGWTNSSIFWMSRGTKKLGTLVIVIRREITRKMPYNPYRNNPLTRPYFWCSGLFSGSQIVASIQTWSRSNSASLFRRSFDFRLFWVDNSLWQKLGLDNPVYQPRRCLRSRSFDWIKFSFLRELVCRETRPASHEQGSPHLRWWRLWKLDAWEFGERRNPNGGSFWITMLVLSLLCKRLILLTGKNEEPTASTIRSSLLKSLLDWDVNQKICPLRNSQ